MSSMKFRFWPKFHTGHVDLVKSHAVHEMYNETLIQVALMQCNNSCQHLLSVLVLSAKIMSDDLHKLQFSFVVLCQKEQTFLSQN